MISAAHPGLLALEESVSTGEPVFMFQNLLTFCLFHFLFQNIYGSLHVSDHKITSRTHLLILKNTKVNINFSSSWKKFPLDNRQSSKTLKPSTVKAILPLRPSRKSIVKKILHHYLIHISLGKRSWPSEDQRLQCTFSIFCRCGKWNRPRDHTNIHHRTEYQSSCIRRLGLSRHSL